MWRDSCVQRHLHHRRCVFANMMPGNLSLCHICDILCCSLKFICSKMGEGSSDIWCLLRTWGGGHSWCSLWYWVGITPIIYTTNFSLQFGKRSHLSELHKLFSHTFVSFGHVEKSNHPLLSVQLYHILCNFCSLLLCFGHFLNILCSFVDCQDLFNVVDCALCPNERS